MALYTSYIMSCGLLCDRIPRCHLALFTGVFPGPAGRSPALSALSRNVAGKTTIQFAQATCYVPLLFKLTCDPFGMRFDGRRTHVAGSDKSHGRWTARYVEIYDCNHVVNDRKNVEEIRTLIQTSRLPRSSALAASSAIRLLSTIK